MALYVKNKTVSAIEIDDFGVTLQPGVILNIDTDYTPNSPEFTTLIDDGDVVFVESDTTELSASDSKDFNDALNLPGYEAYYTSDQVNTLVNSQDHIIRQIVHKNITTVVTTSTQIDESTTPSIADGVTFDSLAITMEDGADEVRIQANVPAPSDGEKNVMLLFRGTTLLGSTVTYSTLLFDLYDSPGAGTHTYYLRVGTEGGNVGYFNRTKDDPTPYGGTSFTNNCNITLTEIE